MILLASSTLKTVVQGGLRCTGEKDGVRNLIFGGSYINISGSLSRKSGRSRDDSYVE